MELLANYQYEWPLGYSGFSSDIRPYECQSVVCVFVCWSGTQIEHFPRRFPHANDKNRTVGSRKKQSTIE